jgi:hypothetical protein
MSEYLCEHGDCETVFDNNDEWDKMHLKRIMLERNIGKMLFIYCTKCKLEKDRKVEWKNKKYRFVSYKEGVLSKEQYVEEIHEKEREELEQNTEYA